MPSVAILVTFGVLLLAAAVASYIVGARSGRAAEQRRLDAAKGSARRRR